jgi:uncharacterized protein YecA (UPF0149 family)
MKDEILEVPFEEEIPNEFKELAEEKSEKLEKIENPLNSEQIIYTKRIRKMLGITLNPYVREKKKLRRNEICPCGSGLKVKKCCGN